jgi:hypothetical protein
MKAKVVHSRKGEFIADVVDVDDEWADATILEGSAKFICPWNEDALPGDTVRIRKSFCTITSLPEQ